MISMCVDTGRLEMHVLIFFICASNRISPYWSKCKLLSSSKKHKHKYPPPPPGFRHSFLIKFNSILQSKPVKMSPYEPIKVSWVIQTQTSPPQKGLIPLSAESEFRGKTPKNETRSNISNKTKNKRQEPCVRVHVLATSCLDFLKSQQHTQRMPLWKHHSLKDYITHLSLYPQPISKLWGRVQSGDYRGNTDLY